MVMLKGAFDATQIDPLDRTTIPAGDYTATITKTEAKENRNGQGSHLNVEFTIIEGPHKGRKVWQNLNCWHPNQHGDNEYKACKPITPAGHQPSPGRAYAQNNAPTGAPTHAPTAHNPKRRNKWRTRKATTNPTKATKKHPRPRWARKR